MAAESEAELNDWLGFLHHHMHQAVTGADGQSRKMYEHVWLVAVQPRSLGSSKGLAGEHHICLTYKSIALVRVGDCQKKIEFPLNSIRRCGHTGSFFFLGLGRSAVTGAGDIWMLTEDAVIAENMHSIIKTAMHAPCNNISEDPVTRERTQSMSNHRSFDVPQHTLQELQRPLSTNATSKNSHTSLFSRPGNISILSSRCYTRFPYDQIAYFFLCVNPYCISICAPWSYKAKTCTIPIFICMRYSIFFMFCASAWSF
nr:insulin receptor substrate 1-like [Cherax quadricarinatus]